MDKRMIQLLCSIIIAMMILMINPVLAFGVAANAITINGNYDQANRQFVEQPYTDVLAGDQLVLHTSSLISFSEPQINGGNFENKTVNIGLGTILLFITGLILLVVEIFVIPGFGVAGISGIILLFLGIASASPSLEYALISILIALVILVLIFIFLLKNNKTRKIWGRLILAQKQENKDGYVAPDVSLAIYLGARGKAISQLRPAGVIEIEGKRIDVVTSGEFIDAGSVVEVILIEGSRVVVREI